MAVLVAVVTADLLSPVWFDLIFEEAAPIRGDSRRLYGVRCNLRTGFRSAQKASQLGKESNANWPQALPASEQGRNLHQSRHVPFALRQAWHWRRGTPTENSDSAL